MYKLTISSASNICYWPLSANVHTTADIINAPVPITSFDKVNSAVTPLPRSMKKHDRSVVVNYSLACWVVSLLTIGSKLGEKWVQERSPVAMEEMQVAEIGSFCLNEACEDYQKVHHGNMIKYGKTDKGVRRYFCKTCRKSFTETKGTMFYRCRHTEEEIVECMSMLGDRNSLAAIHRIKGVKEETVAKWLEKAADHIKQFEHIIRKKKLSRVQLDALWTYVWHKGEKGGSLKKLQEELFGVEKPSTWTVV
jgi:transposase-like protein